MSEVRYRQIATTTWNITNSYDVGTIVTYDGNDYVSLKPVPKGVNIGFTDYWKKITVENDVEGLQNNVEALQSDVEDIQEQLVVTVGEDGVPFKFAYDSTNEVYGFMVGEVFHPFGGEVID